MAAKTVMPPPARRSRRWPLFAAAGLLLAGLGAGGYFWRQHAVVAAHLPATPDLAGFPAELATEVAGAEKNARSWTRDKAGLIALSRFYHANSFYNEALRCYAGLRLLEPREGRWPHLEASILSTFGQSDQALALWRRAAELAPRSTATRLRLGDALLKANQPGPAQEAYRATLAGDPGNPYALLGLARGAIIQQDWAGARTLLQQAVQSHPNFIGGLSLLVVVAEHFGDRNQADDLREAIAGREFADPPDPWQDELRDYCYDAYRLSVFAAVLGFSGQAQAARETLERAIVLAPETSAYRRQLGRLLLEMRDYAGARRHLEKATALAPTDPYAWVALYQLLSTQNELAAADNALAAGLAHCPGSPELHLERARRLRITGQYDLAVAEYSETRRLRPSDASPLVELAGVYFTLGRADEAIATLGQALELQPEHPTALATLAFYYISAGDQVNALKWWEHVRRQSRTPANAVNALRQGFQQRFGSAPP